ncbi:MAG: carboxypeptidase regulatory-like domain-containing protein [Clostridia bacterium]|nr:carboxypeptidase regulatory-like domain-containing protein [Clostridia bacterium]
MKKQFKPFSFLTALILLIVLVLVPTGTFAGASFVKGVFASSAGGNALWEGEGTEAEPYLIQSAEDWDALSEYTNGGGTDYAGKYFLLTEDISVSTMVGFRDQSSADIPFTGTFDGGGHTLNVSIRYSGAMAAPFGSVCNAVIKNLNVTGTVNGGIHSSGLVGGGNKGAVPGSTLEICNVRSSVAVNGYNNSAVSHLGGIVGHSLSARITMDNVVFAGSLNGSMAQGGFVGWGGGAGDHLSICVFSNCLFAGTVKSGNTFHPVGYAYGNNGRATLTNFYTTKDKNNTSNAFDYQGTSYTVLSGLAAKVTDGGAIRYYDNFASAASAQNWKQGSTLTLLGDVSISSTLNVPAGEYTLDLNGYGIRRTGSGCVIRVNEQSTLNLKDSNPSVEHRYSVSNPAANGAGVATVNDALTSGYQTFTGGYITGGYITGGYNYGAGINVEGNGAALNMYGGTIIGNRLTAGSTGGGGVCLQDWTGTGGFHMYGGSIIGNTSNYGGGVYVRCGTMVMVDGEISRNVANNNIGGGLLAFGASSAFIMEGGVINGNYAQHGGAIEASGGAAVSISGGVITNNTASGKGGALTNQRTDGDTSPAVFNISGAPVFSGNTAGGQSSDAYLCNTAVLNVTGELTNTTPFLVKRSSGTGAFTSGWNDKMGDADPSDYFKSENGSYQVFLNPTGEAEIGTPPVACIISGETAAYYTSISAAASSTNWTAGSTLKLLDDVTATAVITAPSGAHTLDLNGHTITRTGATGADNSGLVITVNDGANLTVTGPGKITGGSGFHGGGIHVEGTGSLVLDHCEISGNTGHYGGGLYLKGGTITLKNGTVVKDNLGTDGYGGPGIYAESGGTLILEDCTFTGNRMNSGMQCAVFLCGNAKVQVSGAPVIYDNTYNGEQKNLLFFQANDQQSRVLVTGTLTDGAKIGVRQTNDNFGAFSIGWKDKMGDADPAEYFISDNSGYIVCVTAEGEALLRYPDVPSVSASGVTCDYDGKGHAISVTAPDGATVTYGTQEGDFSLTSSPAFTDAGVHTVYYQVSKTNYTPVTGSATVKIDPISATVTITGHTETADYDGKEHSAAGYDAETSAALFDVTKDFSFSGAAEAKRTDAGKTEMGLAPEQFASVNANFAEVTFVVTDGSVTVLTVDAAITAAPRTGSPIYNGSELPLLIAGTAEGGTFSYALGADAQNAPDAASYQTAIPTAKDLGRYFVWYRVDADHNHNGLPPVCLQVVLAEEGWKTLNGTLYQSDGVTPVAGAAVTLTQGDRTVDAARTDAAGGYQFIVPAGVYNVVASNGASTETTLVKIYEDQDRTLTFSAGSAIAELKVNADGDKHFGVTVDGLTDEALAVRAAAEAADKTVSVLMTVEAKTEETAQNAALINALAGESQNLIFFDTKVEKTVDSVTTVLQTTSNVLELAVPYDKTGKRGVTVYASDGSGVQTLRESDGGEEGTFRIDKENGLIYVYSNRFSTFAIGYTPYYRVESTASLGSFAGTANVVIRSADGSQVFELQNVAPDRISFDDIPKGKYTMTITWEDGAENTLTVPLTIRGKAAASADTANAGAEALAAAKENGAVLAALRRSDADRRSGILTLAAVLTADRAGSPDAGAAGSGVSAFSVSPFGTLVGPIPQADPGAALLRLQKLKRVAMRI